MDIGRRGGKALCIDTLILTNKGFKKLLDVEKNDVIFDMHGKPTKVLYKSEVYKDRVCYDIKFSDGSVIRADENHDWLVDTKRGRKSNARNKKKKYALLKKSTKDLIEEGLFLKRKDGKKETNFSIPVCGPLELEEKQLIIDPYYLGLWLGDGKSNGAVVYTQDHEVVTYLYKYADELGQHIYVEDFVDNKSKGYHIRGGNSQVERNRSLQAKLRRLGLINNKHIPTEYKYASIYQRLELLRGLIDSDGYIAEDGRFEYVTIKRRLAEDVYFLVLSLGIKASLNEYDCKLYGRYISKKYRICFSTNLDLSKIDRKRKRQNVSIESINRRFIIDIEKVDSVPVQCLAVDSKTHTFLAGTTLIPTHNTEAVLNELIKKCIEKPGLYYYIAPSYRQAKSIAWTRLKMLLRPALQYWKFNEQELYAEDLNTFGRIELKGSDNEESLLGVGLKGVVFDESALISETVWTRIVRPMLADSKGWAIFISTPRGKNWFYDLYEVGRSGEDKDWKSWKYPTSVNAYIAQTEIDQMKKDMPERLFMQEIMAEFLDDSTGVFKGLQACIAGTLKKPELGRFYCSGIDLAKSEDFSTHCIIDSVTREVVFFDRFQDVKWTEQKLKFQNWSTQYNNSLCVIDSTGLGDPIVEDMTQSGMSIWYDDKGTPGFKFTQTSKKQLIENLCICIEQRLITIPPTLTVLIDELEKFEYKLTPGGNITYGAPDGRHDDCVIALALACWGLRGHMRTAHTLARGEELGSEDKDKQGGGEVVWKSSRFEDVEEAQYAGY